MELEMAMSSSHWFVESVGVEITDRWGQLFFYIPDPVVSLLTGDSPLHFAGTQ